MTAPGSIVVLGGGPIGMVCALLLARQGLACDLVDARPVEALQRDRRLLALSRGSLLVLESLLGREFAPMAPIERVHVSSRGELGAVHLGARDFDGNALGATVWYSELVGALGRAAQSVERIRIQRPRRAVRVTQRIQCVEVALDDGSGIEGALAIDAEGTPPRVREAEYFALLADVEIDPYRPGEAIERFTREGPLALLPVPGPATQGCRPGAGRMSMIWCLPAGVARARREASESELLAQIGAALGPRMGSPAAIGPRNVFALTTHRLDRICEHRLVHLGNAAQTLHPVAGQGFNLGIRDCVCLADAIAEDRLEAARVFTAGGSGGGPGADSADACGPRDPLPALARYRARRRLDRSLVPGLTSALPRVFSSSLAPVGAARTAALLALDLVPGLRREFTRLLMFGAPR